MKSEKSEIGSEKDENNLIVVQVASPGYESEFDAKIIVNDKVVKFHPIENPDLRGLHVICINPSNGEIPFSRAFDTSETSEYFEKFIDDVGVPKGFIVAAACQDDCVTKLSEIVKKWFEKMGSTEIRNVKYRHGFAFIGKIGFTECQEKITLGTKDQVLVS